MTRYVVVDFETASCADLTKVGAWRYAEDVSTFILSLGYKIVTDNAPAPTVVLAEAEVRSRHTELLELVYDPSVVFVAHNAGFEQAIWQHIMVGQHHWPPLPPERWHDTMAVAARYTLPLNLDKLSATLKLNTQKDREGHALMMQMCKPNHRTGNFDHPPEKMLRLLKYNVADVDAQYEAHCRLGGLGPQERAVWLLNERTNQRGILVDEPYVRQAIGLLEACRVPMEAEFKQITGLKPSQRQKVLDWLIADGANLPNLRKETLDKVLDPENDDDGIEGISPQAFRAIQIRRTLGSSSVKKLNRMLETMCFDGRVRGTMQYHGARTGRVAGRLIQPQNMPRPTVDDISQREIMDMVRRGDMWEIDKRCGNVFDAVISTLRGCFKPGEGRVFAAGDFNAIEARVVLALAGETAKAKTFDTGDPYSDMAATIFGRAVNKKDNPDLRFVGKGTVLGAGFGMGPWKFHMVTVPDKPIEFAEQCIETYRKQWAPLVPKLWYGLEDASTKAVWCDAKRAYEYRGIVYQRRGAYLVCRLPSGREIFYCDPRKEQKAVPWDETDIRPAWSYLSFQGKSAHRKTPFGGLLCLAGETEVLTIRGFVPIAFVTSDDLVWDGLEWVRHDGRIHQGYKEVIDFGGIRLTADHKIWLRDRFVEAADCSFDEAVSSCDALGGAHKRVIDCHEILRREQFRRGDLGSILPMWTDEAGSRQRLQARGRKVLWGWRVQPQDATKTLAGNTRHDGPSGLRSMAIHDRPLPVADASGMAQLRRARDFGLRAVANLRGLLGRYGQWLGEGLEHRAGGQQRPLFAGELSLDTTPASGQEPQGYAHHQYAEGADVRLGSIPNLSDQVFDVAVAHQCGMAGGSTVPVFDLLNAGPRRRFTVRAPDGRCVIVSNCENVTQAVARDIMVAGMFRCEKEGLPVVFTVHDELVTEPEASRNDSVIVLQQCMEEREPWVVEWGIPVAAECDLMTEYQK